MSEGDYRPGLNDLGFVGPGIGKGHVLGRIGTKQLMTGITPSPSDVHGKPVRTGLVVAEGRLRKQHALKPEQSPGLPRAGDYLVQCQRIRKHMARCQRALRRARDDDHKTVLEGLIETDILKLKNIQGMVLEGKINLKPPLSKEPKAPISLLPRGMVPRGFNK